MKTIPQTRLKKQYIFVCNEYVKKFVNKHGYEFTGWVSDEVGGLTSFIDQYFFCISDIIYDISHRCPKGKIFEWQDYNLKHPEDYMNYHSFVKGLKW